MKSYLLLLPALAILGCTQPHKKSERDLAGLFEKQSEQFSDQGSARTFDLKSVAALASSGPLRLESGELVLDNDDSFDSKLEIIRKAQKEIRAVYYIYSLDHTSAVMTDAFVTKAASGVKVKLLVDLITNFGNLDLFRYMEKAGKGNLTVYFYNFPTPQIRKDAAYLSAPCPIVEKPQPFECAKYKASLIRAEESTFFSRVLLAGMYGKNPALLKASFSLGAGIDPKNYQGAGGDEETQKQILEFLKIVRDAYFKNDLIAKIKLSIALATYGESLNPLMNEITGRLPLSNSIESTTKQAQEWDHITDYTHHKLLISDSKRFQLGGRNIEDSYHLQKRIGGTGKYIFMDTDFYAVTRGNGAQDLEKAFDKLLSVPGLVATFKDLDREMATEVLANTPAFLKTVESCLQKSKTSIASCVESGITQSTVYVSTDKRMQEIGQKVKTLKAEYLKEYKKEAVTTSQNWKKEMGQLSQSDLNSAQVYYLENLPFKKDSAKPVRELGAKLGLESKYSKNIHEAWYRSLESACATSRKENREVRVIFNSAYVFMPSGLVYRLSKMINGGYGDCSRVRITFLTNSFETTDLNIINLFARYQLKEIFQYYSLVQEQFKVTAQNVAPRKIEKMYPELEYFEYNKSHVGQGISLHTKLTLADEDMIVGSANADTRSYFMDTNNALFIRGALDLNKAYRNYIDREIKDSRITTPMHTYFSQLTFDRINQENVAILQGALARWDKKGRVSEKNQKRILEAFADLGARITHDTQTLLDYRRQIENARFENQMAASEVEKELNETANRFDDFFKLL